MTDDEFVQEIYALSYRLLVGQLYAVCSDLATAEDVVQEAFVRAVAQRRTFRKLDNPEAWLYRVALNVHHIADLPVHEIAATLGIPAGTIKARLSRGRSALADVLTEEDHHA